MFGAPGIFNSAFWAREQMFPTAVISGIEKAFLLSLVALLMVTHELTLLTLTSVYACLGMAKTLTTVHILLHRGW